MKCCENCGWLSVNPSGAMFCGYSDQRTWKDECCIAWKDKNEPKTNADRIRAMTDEELARYMVEVQMYAGCPNDGAIACRDNCAVCWLDWLREVDNGA